MSGPFSRLSVILGRPQAEPGTQETGSRRSPQPPFQPSPLGPGFSLREPQDDGVFIFDRVAS
jgi:hypothetical protein